MQRAQIGREEIAATGTSQNDGLCIFVVFCDRSLDFALEFPDDGNRKIRRLKGPPVVLPAFKGRREKRIDFGEFFGPEGAGLRGPDTPPSGFRQGEASGAQPLAKLEHAFRIAPQKHKTGLFTHVQSVRSTWVSNASA